MKHLLLLALVVCDYAGALAQTEPKVVGYFNLGWQQVDKEKAAFYRTVEPAGDRFLVKDYYKSGQLQMEAVCTAYEPKLIWKGITKLYHENGAVSEEGMFENEARMGMHTYWYPDGKKKKEVIHVEKKNVMVQFWSTAGDPLLVNGNGTIKESETAPYEDVQDSIVVTTYQVDNGTDTVYTLLPEQPEFKGGLNGLMRTIKSRMHYPIEAQRARTKGRVFINFVVDKQGNVRDAKVLKGLSPECDAESLRVVSTLNGWTPGRWRGKPVAVRFVLPINFAL